MLNFSFEYAVFTAYRATCTMESEVLKEAACYSRCDKGLSTRVVERLNL